MFIFTTRRRRADAPDWPGRRPLAIVDAIVWPVLWLALLALAPFDLGVVGWVAMGLAGVAAISRAHRAIWHNERYWFTTFRWGVPTATLVAIGFAISTLA